MVKIFTRLSFLFIMALATNSVLAHEVRPAVLKIKELGSDIYQVTLKVPALGDRHIRLKPIFPENFVPLAPAVSRKMEGSFIEQITLSSTKGETLFGKEIIMEGLTELQIDVIVQMEFADGSSISGIVQPKSPVFEIPERGSKAKIVSSYFNMGVFHILSGIDHLLFVLALMLLVVDFKKLLKTITAFTLAHSVTLALAALGFVNIPSAPTEAIIALSIVFLSMEIIQSRKGEKSITAKYPWIVAMIFGLFHGLGFAGALSEIGLPQHEIPLALLMFNVGVEVGQIMFITAVFLILIVTKKFIPKWPDRSWKLIPYAIGSIAAFWTIERISSFIS